MAFKPWVCMRGHRLEIDDVSGAGLCRLCRSDVKIETTPEEVGRAIQQDSLRPSRKVMIDDRWHKVARLECTFCHILYDTPYVNSKFCTPKCKVECQEKKLRERRTGIIYCLFCGVEVQTDDKRRRFCKPQCRKDHKKKRSYRRKEL